MKVGKRWRKDTVQQEGKVSWMVSSQGAVLMRLVADEFHLQKKFESLKCLWHSFLIINSHT